MVANNYCFTYNADYETFCIYSRKSFHFCKLIGHILCNYSVNTLNIPTAIRHLQNEHGVIVHNGSCVEIQHENFEAVIKSNANKSMWTPILLNLEKDYCGASFVVLSIVNGGEDCDNNTISWICFFMGESSSYDANEFLVEFSIQTNQSMKDFPELKWSVSPVTLLQAEAILQICPYRIPVSSLTEHYSVEGSLKVAVSITYKGLKSEMRETKSGTSNNSSKTESDREPISIFNNDIIISFTQSRQETTLSPSGETAVFHDVSCDFCREKPLTRIRYKCLQCPNYDLCKTCKDQGIHSHHVFAVLTSPHQNSFIADLLKSRDASNSIFTTESQIQPMANDYCGPLPDDVTCNGCCVVPISGMRYKCLQCLDFNLCLPCMAHKIHSRHVLVMIQNFGQQDFVRKLARIR